MISDIIKFGVASGLEDVRNLLQDIVTRRSFSRFRVTIDGYLMVDDSNYFRFTADDNSQIYIERDISYKMVDAGENKELFLLAGYHHVKIIMDIFNHYPSSPISIEKSPRKSMIKSFFEVNHIRKSPDLFVDDHLIAELLPSDFACHQECRSQISALQEALESHQTLSEAKLEVLQRLLEKERQKNRENTTNITESTWTICSSFSSCISSLLDCHHVENHVSPSRVKSTLLRTSISGLPSTEMVALKASPFLSHENASSGIPVILRDYNIHKYKSS